MSEYRWEEGAENFPSLNFLKSSYDSSHCFQISSYKNVPRALQIKSMKLCNRFEEKQ